MGFISTAVAEAVATSSAHRIILLAGLVQRPVNGCVPEWLIIAFSEVEATPLKYSASVKLNVPEAYHV